jgi:hypothetical protein
LVKHDENEVCDLVEREVVFDDHDDEGLVDLVDEVLVVEADEEADRRD